MTALKTKQQKAAVQIQEAIKHDAILFVKRLKYLASIQKFKGDGDGTTVKDTKVADITYAFEHSKAYNSLSSHYQSKVPNPIMCAVMQGLINREREGNKPYTYKILEAVERFELRPYQQSIISRASEAKGSVLIEAPTGSGKTIMALEITKREIEKGGKVLFVAPRRVLLQQTAETFAALDPQIIHNKKDYDKDHNVFISTLQTAHRRKLGFEPTLCLIDESHIGHTGKMMEQLLSDFKGKVVALSATPYQKDGNPLDGFDLHINDYDINYMISNGYLVPPICYKPVKVNLKDLRIVAGDYNQNDLDQRFNNIESVMQVVDSTKAKLLERKHGIVFCITIAHAKLMADAFNDAGIKTEAYHSQLSEADKQRIMDSFKAGDIKVLTNPASLAEGFDFPALDTLVIARPTKSQNRARQMVGRALRTAEGKTEAVILDCAGMIENTGLPTSPIRPKEEYEEIEAKQPICNECASKRVYRKIKDNKTYKVCAECGHREEIESQAGYECEECGKIHGNDAEFIAHDSKLNLSCDCGHYTVISEATSHDELLAIFDKQLVETLKRRITATYCTALISKYGTEFIYSDEVRRQITAIGIFIQQHPEDAVSGTLERITHRMSGSPDKWRLLDKHYENELLPQSSMIEDVEMNSSCIAPEPKQDTKALEAMFYGTRGFDAAVKALNILLEAKDKAPLKEWVIDKTVQQLKGNSIKGIEAMTTKRLKNLYSNDKETNTIDTFIPYIEQQRSKQ